MPFEFMMNALRLNEGVPARFYNERTGYELEKYSPSWIHYGNVICFQKILNNSPVQHMAIFFKLGA